MSRHETWINYALGSNPHAVAKAIGADPSYLYKKVKAEKLSAEQVIAISEAFDVDPVRSLVDTGFLKPREEEPETPEVIQRRIHADLEKLDRAWRNHVDTGRYDQERSGDMHREADLIDFPTPTGIYTDDDEEEMPEDAVAYGREAWGDPDGDNDY